MDDAAGFAPLAHPTPQAAFLLNCFAAPEHNWPDVFGQWRRPRLPVVLMEENRRQLNFIGQFTRDAQVLVDAIWRRPIGNNRKSYFAV
jgi:hypothetical protein